MLYRSTDPPRGEQYSDNREEKQGLHKSTGPPRGAVRRQYRGEAEEKEEEEEEGR